MIGDETSASAAPAFEAAADDDSSNAAVNPAQQRPLGAAHKRSQGRRDRNAHGQGLEAGCVARTRFAGKKGGRGLCGEAEGITRSSHEVVHVWPGPPIHMGEIFVSMYNSQQ